MIFIFSNKMIKKPEQPNKIKSSNNLRVRQIIEVTITALNDDALGIASHEGTRILVSGAFPGELVKARVTYIGQRETFTNVEKVLRHSPDRTISPPCTKGATCEGCPLIQMSYPAQLKWKKEQTRSMLARYGSLGDVPVQDVLASPKQLHYLNSAKLVISGKSADPLIGTYRGKSNTIQESSDCQLRHPLIDAIVKEIRTGIRKGKVPVYNPRSDMGLLRYLFIRVSETTNRAMVVIVTREEGYNEIHHLAKHLKNAVPETAVIIQNINTTKGKDFFGQRDRFISKDQTLQTTIGDRRLALSHRSFFPINSSSVALILDKIVAWGTGSGKVVDLYCGTGILALALAQKVKEVIGFDSSVAAIADASRNAQLNGSNNCHFEAGDCTELLNDLCEKGEAIDLMLITPPHSGTSENLLKAVVTASPKRIIHVSTSLKSMATDLYALSKLGYKTTEIQPVDMLPHSAIVDCVALLHKIS